jgi:UDP-N-acetylmuramate dehydrogenase
MEIIKNCSLKKYNTFGLEATAKYMMEINQLDDLLEILKSNLAKTNKLYFLGGGSNILLCNDIDGIVIINKIEGIHLQSETENEVVLKVYSGTNWHQLVLYAVENKWYGIENMSLIPGSVGAAPMQNIGAYGAELKDTFVRLEALNLSSLQLETFEHNECAFGYRESVFKRNLIGQYFIYSVTLRLSKHHKTNTSYGDIESTLIQQSIAPANASIKQVSDAIIAIRQSKLPNPAELGNSGSFFKNPVISASLFNALKEKFPDIKGYEVPEGVKVPAGWLIESLGWKGKRIGNTGSNAKQALVLVNYGNAKGAEVKKLAYDIIKSVEDTYQIKLEPEVNIWE